jgi:tetratricopeptide (TPR) repeat protein
MSLIALTILALPFSQSSTADIVRAEQTRLNECIALSEEDAETAYEDSLRWLGEGARPAARYCNAMAILGMGNYREAAARLEELANAPDAGGLDDRAIYLAQAGNAWLLGGYSDAAIVTLTNALKIASSDPDILTDRGAAYLGTERYEEAIDDLDKALDIVPNAVETLQMRARAHLAQDNLDAAEADMNRALLLDRTNIDTLVLRGDVREAKRLAEGS